MSWPADYHMHTYLCRHAVGTPTELAAQAVNLGFTEIGFSDHAPMPRDDWDDWRMARSELVTYVDLVEQARRDHPQLAIRLALEVDYLPGVEDWIREMAALPVWDYLIGSVHYLSGDWNFDNPAKREEWNKRDAFEVWSDYFGRLTQAAESGLFDIIGHADLCKRFQVYPKQDCSLLVAKFLTAAKRSNVAIELNTAGLRKDCREIYPSPTIVQMARKLGVPITFGSDAHKPEEVGAGFPEALALARGAGYTHCCRFAQRRREEVPF
jgi:histidinol-phosphatase (PHP family)